MEIDDKVDEIEKKVNKQSVAMELLEYSKEQNKQLKSNYNISMALNFVLVILFAFSIGYIIYLLNDIGTTTETIEIEGVESIDNSHIKIGDDIWEKLE